MSDHIERTLADLAEKITAAEAELIDKKRLANLLCAQYGRAPMYQSDDLMPKAAQGSIRGDQFYGKALATAIREYLEMRRQQGAATVSEIFAALKTGGFKFDTKSDENAKRAMRISLSKNTAMFHRIPNGAFGLREWYPNVKDAKPEPIEAEDAKGGDDDAK